MGQSGYGHKNVIFVGLMLGVLVAAVSQTIVSPAMPAVSESAREVLQHPAVTGKRSCRENQTTRRRVQ